MPSKKKTTFQTIIWKNHSTPVLSIPPEKMQEAGLRVSTRKDPANMQVVKVTIEALP